MSLTALRDWDVGLKIYFTCVSQRFFMFSRLRSCNKAIRRKLKKGSTAAFGPALDFNDRALDVKLLGSYLSEGVSANFRYQIFWHLFRLKNFATAARVGAGIDPRRLELREQLFIVQALISGSQGVNADRVLERVISDHAVKELTPTEKVALIDRIVASGLPREQKIEILKSFYSCRCPAHGFKDDEYVKFSIYRTLADAHEIVLLEDYLDLTGLERRSPSFLFRVFAHLRSEGNVRQLSEFARTCSREKVVRDLDWFRLAMKYFPEFLVENRVGVAELRFKWRDDLNILRRAHECGSMGEFFREVTRQCSEHHQGAFDNKSIYEKDAFLYVLIGLDLLDDANALISSAALPNTVLSAQVVSGFDRLLDDDYQSAYYLFANVLKENPANTHAALGLRFCLPRNGQSVSEMARIRGEIGFGAAGYGRPGPSRAKGNSVSESVICDLMAGEYQKGYFQKRHQPHWKLLKRKLGARFLNYDPLPEGGSLFVIADDGVGDEVRAAQFYGLLEKRYDRVSATCDPRLLNIFQRAFPSIQFVPVPRARSGVVNSVNKGERMSGLGLKLHNYLTREVFESFDRFDHVTFGQNLFFNHFIGNLGRPETGGYLERFGRESTRPHLPEAKFKVGLLWRSHLASGGRRFMYLAIEELSSIFDVDGVEFWSLQHEITGEEAECCRSHGVRLIEDVNLFNDFDGLSERIKDLDVVIGISSLPVELAAALGVPVWLLGYSPENYYLRTKGGRSEVDHLTLNSRIIAPSWIDFTAPRRDCVYLTVSEARARLEHLMHGSGHQPAGLN